MVFAVERVRERLIRATAALEAGKVDYALAGGNAVAAWVATVDPAAVRNTQDVDLLIRRCDLRAATRALAPAGLVHRHSAGIDMFLDGADGKARDAVHVVMAGEKVRPDYPLAAPDVSESQKTEQFRLLSLDALVRMKLTSFRRKDQVHLLDLLDVGLIDESWLEKVPEALGGRLKHLIETPDE